MKSSRAFTVTLALVIATSIAYLIFKTPSRVPKFPIATEVVKSKQNQQKTKSITRVNDLARPSSSKSSHIKSIDPSLSVAAESKSVSLFDICEKSWSELTQRGLEDLQKDLLGRRLLLTPNCLRRMKEEIKARRVQSFIENCQSDLDHIELSQIEQTCYSELPILRAFVLRQLRRDEIALENFDTFDLSSQLLGGFLDLKNASNPDINRNISISDVLLLKDPNLYAAYKGKLISLLIKELKFREEVDLTQYENLYSELITFQGGSERDQILEKVRALELQFADNTVESNQFTIDASELKGLDSDLVQIPFLRLKALGDFESMTLMAEEYLDTYPNSYIGYMYLAEAAWATGDKDEAVIIIKNVLGNQTSDSVAYEIINQLASRSVLDVISEMKLE